MAIEVIFADNAYGKTTWANEKEKEGKFKFNSKITNFIDDGYFSFAEKIKKEYDEKNNILYNKIKSTDSIKKLFPGLRKKVVTMVIEKYYNDFHNLDKFSTPEIIRYTSSLSVLVKDIYEKHSDFIKSNLNDIAIFAISERISSGLMETELENVYVQIMEINESISFLKSDLLESINEQSKKWISDNKITKEVAEILVNYSLESKDTTLEFIGYILKKTDEWSLIQSNISEMNERLSNLPKLIDNNGNEVEKINVNEMSDGEVVGTVLMSIKEDVILDDVFEKLDLNNARSAFINILNKYKDNKNIFITTHNAHLFEMLRNIASESGTSIIIKTMIKDGKNYRAKGFNGITTIQALQQKISDDIINNQILHDSALVDFVSLIGRYSFKASRTGYSYSNRGINKEIYSKISKIYKNEKINNVSSLFSQDTIDLLSETFSGKDVIQSIQKRLLSLQEKNFIKLGLNKQKILDHLEDLFTIADNYSAKEGNTEMYRKVVHKLDNTITSIMNIN